MDSDPLVLDPATQNEILQTLMAKLKANYIFPDVAEQICAGLQKHQADGEYDDIDEGDFFALALTLHMQEVNHDEHLWVRFHTDPLPDDDGQLRLNPEWQAERQREAREDNYGLRRVEVLPGNVGLLDLRYFHRPEWGGEPVSSALASLARTDALIVDLRECPGGYPGMVALVCDSLFDGPPLLLHSIYWRDEDKTQEFWTTPERTGERFGTQKPVYVLMSRQTFSAAEGFADILQSRKRAIIIGEKTDGGANPGASYRLHPHFEAFLPIGRVTNPVTGTNWEGKGITPDISVPQEQAFTAAYR
ncbi:MAG: S41 family peptidase, partial [Anaerolineales bacterium]|nr:S41 family peptidase [Anaerolineales bacterium]